MSTIQSRGLIALAALAVALFSSKSADAQALSGATPEPGGTVNELATGVAYDRKNLAAAAHHLPHLQAKLKRDAERGRTDCVARDVRRIEGHKYRMAVDCWLIKMNSLKDPGYYPIRIDEISTVAIGQATGLGPIRP